MSETHQPPEAEANALSRLRKLAQDLSSKSDLLTRADIAFKSGIAIDETERVSANAAFGAAGSLFIRTLEAAQAEHEQLTTRALAAEARVVLLERCMRDVIPTCEQMHHAKKDQGHDFTKCPVVERFTAALNNEPTPERGA